MLGLTVPQPYTTHNNFNTPLKCNMCTEMILFTHMHSLLTYIINRDAR